MNQVHFIQLGAKKQDPKDEGIRRKEWKISDWIYQLLESGNVPVAEWVINEQFPHKNKSISLHFLFSRLVAVNKMVCHFWLQFLIQFSFLFQMVSFFFLSMAAFRTTNTELSDWLLALFQPIRLWFSELPYRAKWMVPSERALKI